MLMLQKTCFMLPRPDAAATSRCRRRARVPRDSRMAFNTTATELSDMPMAASHGGTRPNAASGSAARL